MIISLPTNKTARKIWWSITLFPFAFFALRAFLLSFGIDLLFGMEELYGEDPLIIIMPIIVGLNLVFGWSLDTVVELFKGEFTTGGCFILLIIVIPIILFIGSIIYVAFGGNLVELLE